MSFGTIRPRRPSGYPRGKSIRGTGVIGTSLSTALKADSAISFWNTVSPSADVQRVSPGGCIPHRMATSQCQRPGKGSSTFIATASVRWFVSVVGAKTRWIPDRRRSAHVDGLPARRKRQIRALLTTPTESRGQDVVMMLLKEVTGFAGGIIIVALVDCNRSASR